MLPFPPHPTQCCSASTANNLAMPQALSGQGVEVVIISKILFAKKFIFFMDKEVKSVSKMLSGIVASDNETKYS